MKRISLFIAALLFTVFMLAACGTNADTQDDDDNNVYETPTEEQQMDADQDYMIEKIESLDNYKEFELEVKYDNNKEYEAKIEHEDDQVTADLEDELNNINIKGKEAFDEIFPIIEQLTISQQTNKDEAITEVLEAFNLNSDYIKLEVELTFKDNTKIEFEDNK